MQRWKLIIEYQGTEYSGWQRQGDGVRSIQESIEGAIFAFCQQRLTIHVAGRTDAGVHACGQVAHFDLDYGDRELGQYDLRKALNAHLRPQPITIIHAEKVSQEFHARFSATNKLYCYHLLNRQGLATFEQNLVWHIRRPLDVDAMREAARHLIGKHDFTTFRDTDCQAKSPIKTLDRLDIVTTLRDDYDGRDVKIYAEGRSFLHHQVRNMVGTLVLVGNGRWTPEDVKIALQARDRRAGGPTAVPDGLFLMRVDY